VNDFEFAISEIELFLQQSIKRAIEIDQLNLVLNKKIDHLKQTTSTLNLSDLSFNEKATYLFLALPRVVDLLNSSEMKELSEDNLLKLYNISNFMLLSLANTPGVLDIWFHQASDVIIGKVLTGIPELKNLPYIPPPKDPTFEYRFRLIFNSLLFTSGVFIGTVRLLKTIASKTLIEWSSKSFWYLKLLKDYIGAINLEDIFQYQKLSIEKYYERILDHQFALNNIYLLSYALQQILGDGWLVQIKTHNVVSEKSAYGLVKISKWLIEIIDTRLNYLQHQSQEGLISSNDNPDNSINIKRLKNLRNAYLLLNNINSLLKQVIKPIKVNNYTETVKKQLDSLINDYYTYRELLMGFPPGDKSLTPFYVQQTIIHLSLIGLKALVNNSYRPLISEMTKFSWLFEENKLTNYPELEFSRLLIHLVLITNLKLIKELPPIRDKLEKIIDRFKTRPRDFIAINILISLSSFVLQDKPNQILKNYLKDSQTSLEEDGGQYHLKELLKVYLKGLNELFDGETKITLPIRENLGRFYLDPYSWLIPDFNNVLPNIEIKNPLYIPFNLLNDAIIRS
jgi:hypothetical protein